MAKRICARSLRAPSFRPNECLYSVRVTRCSTTSFVRTCHQPSLFRPASARGHSASDALSPATGRRHAPSFSYHKAAFPLASDGSRWLAWWSPCATVLTGWPRAIAWTQEVEQRTATAAHPANHPRHQSGTSCETTACWLLRSILGRHIPSPPAGIQGRRRGDVGRPRIEPGQHQGRNGDERSAARQRVLRASPDAGNKKESRRGGGHASKHRRGYV